MALEVHPTDDPTAVLREAGAFLADDPVRHHVIRTLLDLRRRYPEPGRYWVVADGADVVGVALQSPLDFPATIGPMPVTAVDALVAAIADRGVVLPGVNGEAATAAAFAGRWTEVARTGAEVEGQRLYEVAQVVPPTGVPGRARRAGPDDVDDAAGLLEAFAGDTGQPVGGTAARVEQWVAVGGAWLWEDAGEPVALAGISPAAGGVRRVGPVYTPADRRRRGYGSAVAAAVSSTVLAGGERCILYTELANATSNGIYRAIGYRAVTEVLRYRFGARSGGNAGTARS